MAGQLADLMVVHLVDQSETFFSWVDTMGTMRYQVADFLTLDRKTDMNLAAFLWE
jgi:hypothetical protein